VSAAERPPTGERAHPERVLVVDDNAQNRAVAEGFLSAAGYVVLTVDSGKAAIGVFEEFHPDLVLLDILMPGMDGYETCRRLRAIPGGADTPIVFLTALADFSTHRQALDAGADDFLTKPINRTELQLRARSLIRIKRLSRELTENLELTRSQHEALLRAQRQKEELTQLVVHDLKSPLTAITGNVDFALSEPGMPPDSRAALGDALGAAHTMLRMVMNLLDISRSEDGALLPQIEPVELAELLGRVRRRMERQAAMRKQELRLEVPPELRVHADPDLLRRVVENLIDNSCKYSPQKAAIRIEAAALDDDGGECEIRVRDEGPGVPPALRERIFEKYVRLVGDEEPGTRTSRGLGLSFCRMAVEAHGGRIWVEDNHPTGAVFCVRLPRRN
jgi:signal transduction histidine kinase